MIRVFIVDDHAVVRAGLRYAFSQAGDIEVAGEAESGAQALAMLHAGEFKADVLLLDIGLPDKSGIALLADIRREAPELPVLFLSTFAENEFVRLVLNEGAKGYVAKGADVKTLTAAIRAVASGGSYLSPAALEILAANRGTRVQNAAATFSPREREILLLLAKGKGLTEIGRELNLSVKTVSTYRSRILEKTGLSNNAELTRHALNLGLIS